MDYEITTASQSDVRALWKTIFADSDAYLDAYFSQVFVSEQTLAIYCDGILASSLQLIPYDICIDGRFIKAYYVYAVMTREENRKQGMMAALLAEAQRRAEKNGVGAMFLIAQDSNLVSVYRKFGYEPSFASQSRFMNDASQWAAVEPTADNVNSLRTAMRLRALRNGGVLHSREQMMFAVQNLVNEGWQLIEKMSGTYAVAVAKRDGNGMVVLDSVGADGGQPLMSFMVPMVCIIDKSLDKKLFDNACISFMMEK